MKKFYTLVVLLPILVFSQSKYLGFYNNNDVGAIVSIENDTFQIDYELYDNGIPFERLVEINGMLYGITTHPPLIGMGHGSKVLYRYDYTNESFEVLMRLDTGYDFYSNLIAGGGKLYSFKVGGDPLYGGEGFLVEIDPVTLNVTELVNLSSHNIDHHDFVDFVYAPNNKLYGIVRTGGANDEGILFSYDLTTGTYTVEYEFGSTMGKFPIHLINHSNGKLYGVTEDGGTNDHGTIFEFDITNNVYTKLYDLTQMNEAYTLAEGDTNKLYGFTNEQYNGGGRIYQFDISTNTFTNLHYFSTGTGPASSNHIYMYNPLIYKNHTLYGTNRINSHEGMLFSYDITNDIFNEYSIYYFYNDGQTYPLIKTHDDRIFFNTTENFFDSYGALYEFDTSSNSIIKKNGVKYGTNGTYPTKMIISSHNGLVYGITGTTFNDYGSRLFSYNYETGEYRVLINFSVEDYGNPPNGIIESSNGLIYVTTAFSVGLGGQGKIIEYNPYNNTHSVVHNFSDQSGPVGNFSANVYPIGLLEENNIIYGYKVHGGGNTLENGTFFSFNTLTHTYNILYESAELEHVLALINTQPDNKLYGVTTVGGNQNQGYIFSFDIHSGAFNVIESINQAGTTWLTRTTDGNVYGILQYSHGADGSIFKIDTNDNFSVYYQFDNTNNPTTGFNPDYITSVGNNLYVISSAPTCSSCGRNLLTEVNTDNFSFRNLADINIYGASRTIYQISYVMNDNRLIGEGIYGFYSYYQGDNSLTQINIPTSVYHLMDITNAQVSVPPRPNVSLQPVDLYLDADGNVTITDASIFDNGSSDPSGIASFSVTPDTFNCSNLGTNTVTITVTNNLGYSSNAQTTANVLDSIAPVNTTPNTVQLDLNGNTSVSLSDNDITGTDNCGITSKNWSQYDFTTTGNYQVTAHIEDASGNFDDKVVNVEVIDSANEINDAEVLGFKVYPNPASTSIKVSADKTIDQVEIYDMDGRRIVIKQNVKESIFVGNLLPGIYLIRVQAGKQTETFKWVKL